MAGLFLLPLVAFVWPPADGWTGQHVFPREPGLIVRDDLGESCAVIPFGGRVVRADGDRVLIRHGGHPGPAEGWAAKAEVVRPADAAAHFTARLEADEDDAWAYLNRAEAHTRRGDHAAALADYDAAVALLPEPGVYISRGDARARSGDLDKAEADFSRAIDLEPDHPAGYAHRGEARHARGDLDGALRDLDAALALAPDLAELYLARGKVRLRRGEYDRAVADGTEAVRLDPGHAEAYLVRGWAWHAGGGWEEAAAEYTEALRLGLPGPEAFENRARAWASLGRLDRAEADLAAALGLAPLSPDLRRLRGILRYERKDFPGAAADFAEAARLAPHDPQGHYMLGAARLMQGEAGRAYLAFAEAAARAPVWSKIGKDAVEYRGHAFALHNAHAAAVEKARQAAADAPDDPAAANALAWLLATCPDGLHRDGRRAVELATKACEKSGWKEAKYLDTLAAAHAEAGEPEKAVEYQQKALADEAYRLASGDAARARLVLYGAGVPHRDAPAADR
ncbi:MAG: tetratricopeptide repeat protein [Gemmataceae bacterium]|nr:tetratricopeptide repeat protein [Gemmataceae bacterium]